MQPTKTPDYPWQRVGMDLFEQKGHQYLLVVHYFSRWTEIAHLTQTTSSAVIEHMKAIFARQGIPEVIVSDTSPQFNSRMFVSFSENYGFTHPTSSPLHPQGNGEAERAVQTVKKLLKKADDPYVALLNYNATPLQHGSSPAELLMGKKLRTRVPTLPTQHVPDGRDMSKFQETDAHLKLRQKINYDLGQDSWRCQSCSGGTIINRLHSIVQHPDGERHPKKGPTSSLSQRSTIFIRLRWGTQANIHHRTEPVVTEDTNNERSV